MVEWKHQLMSVNMETHAARPGKQRSKINIDVNLERTLTKTSCMEIVEDLLKYILYQRRQIPVQFEVLAREVARAEREAGLHSLDATSAATREKNENQVYSRKEEIARQKLDRKRQRWLRKVKNLIEDFKTVMQRLHTEFERGEVIAVNLILGCSVLSSREVFSINLPHNYYSVCELEGLNSRHNAMQFFRTLITNEDLLKLVNGPSSILKVWVMLQKMHSPSTFMTFNGFRSQAIIPVPDTSSSGLIPRLGYSPNFRAQVVQINVHHPTSVGTPMDLTPSVGSGIIQCTSTSCRKMATKRSFGFDLSGVSKRYSFSSDISNKSNLHCKNSSSSDGGNKVSTSDHKETVCLETFSGIKTHNYNFHESPCLSNQRFSHRRGLETPVNHSIGIAPIRETPVVSSFTPDSQLTPSKLITSQMGNFTLSDGCLNDFSSSANALWYQIDHAICGFKDLCLKQ